MTLYDLEDNIDKLRREIVENPQYGYIKLNEIQEEIKKLLRIRSRYFTKIIENETSKKE